jgi:methylase of polypeptide subunit release factors
MAKDRPAGPEMLSSDDALVELLDRLSEAGYRFVPPTPSTHGRVLERRKGERAGDLRDVFGWSLPFGEETLAPALFGLLCRAGMIEPQGDLFVSAVRVASVDGKLFLHSRYPTESEDSVFLGPDSYRFVRFLDQELANGPTALRLVDIGAGAGVGALACSRHLPGASLTLTDINPLALRLARINARHARVQVETLQGSGLEPVAGEVDLVVANPPYMLDGGKRAYRDGGSMHGAGLSLEWALAAASRLPAGGRMLLYTGSAIIGGEDALEAALREQLPTLGCELRYAELDPDIFGEQLDEPGYERVERIAAVGAVISKS